MSTELSALRSMGGTNLQALLYFGPTRASVGSRREMDEIELWLGEGWVDGLAMWRWEGS